MEKLGLKQSDIVRITGAKKGAVSTWVNGKNEPLGGNAAKFAQALSCNYEWLSGESNKLIELDGKTAPLYGVATEIDLENNPDYPSIRRVSFKASAGISGFEVQQIDSDLPPIVFSKSFYERRKLDPAKLFAICVNGESMEPGLYNNDWIVVNTASTKPKDGVVFSINYDGEIVIKRLELSARGWLATSDNRKFKDKEMTENCFIIGEVIHKQSERI